MVKVAYFNVDSITKAYYEKTPKPEAAVKSNINRRENLI